jgi:hypothetical protein
MANVLAPFGFRHIGYQEGFPPSYGMRKRRIALGNTNPIFHGNAVISLSTGYISQPTANTVQIAGIFQISTATGPEAYEATIHQLEQEMAAAEAAPEAVRQKILGRQHWRKCAEQARRHAGKFIAPEIKRAVLDLADSYELLAQRADERAEEDQLRGR